MVSCEEQVVILQKEKLKKVEFTSLDKELKLKRAMEEIGFFTNSSSSGRLMSGISAVVTDSILKVIQADSINFSYTVSLSNETKSDSFRNLIFSRVSNGFIAYVLEYESISEFTGYSSFTGIVKKYDLEGNYLAEVPIDKADFSNSSGRTKACFADVSVECIRGGEFNGWDQSTGVTVYTPCEEYVTIITIDCMGDSGGTGGATGGWNTQGTYIPDPYSGGSGTGTGNGTDSGSGYNTPPSDGSPFEGGIGVLPPNKQNLKEIRLQQIRDSVYFVIENPCLQAMVTKAVYENINNQISRIINLIFQNSEKFDLGFHEVNDLPDTTLGEARVDHLSNGRILADIFLNVNVLKNSSQEMIISTIFHEVLHAYLGYSRSQELFYDHEEMANEYLNLMTNALQNLFPYISNKNAQALSWGGLSETTAWTNLVNSNPNKANEIILINQNHTNGTTGTKCN